MRLEHKTFQELTNQELYEILKLRAEVFVVEQECAYLDVDGIDYDAMHIFLIEDEVYAYARLFWKEDGILQIGRVVTRKRKEGLGKEIMEEALAYASTLHPKQILIEAQVYAQPFYEQFGFVAYGETFLEDGIPHICMKIEKE